VRYLKGFCLGFFVFMLGPIQLEIVESVADFSRIRTQSTSQTFDIQIPDQFTISLT
jgi:hypothetical protein